MTKNVFGTPARKALAALTVTAAMIVPLVLFGGTALARTVAAVGQYEYSGSGQYQYGGSGGSSGHQYKVRVCHRTHSRKHPWVMIFINWHAMKAHLKHGDTTWPCRPVRFEKVKKGRHSKRVDRVFKRGGEKQRGHDQKTTFTQSSTPVTSSRSQGNGQKNGWSVGGPSRGHGGDGGGDHGGGGRHGGGNH
jgi:uncharacterized membrane protein YgcG